MSSRVATSTVPSGAVLVHLDTKAIVRLNETGAVVWAFLSSSPGSNVSSISARLIEEFEVSPAQAEQDVVELLDELVSVGAVEVE